MSGDPSLGEAAYEGYFTYSGGVSLVSGVSLPDWDEQSPAIKGAWEAAGAAAVDLYEGRIREANSLPDDTDWDFS